MGDDEWACNNCGSDDPHSAITLYDEIEVDVTCESVYITPVDGGHGFAFDHEAFGEIIDHFKHSTQPTQRLSRKGRSHKR